MKQVTKHNKKLEKQIFSLVLDMNNIMKISTVNHDMNNDGKEYGMVTTALRIIGDVLKKKDFDYCIACYDGIGSGVLRWKYYKDYKANRGKNYERHDPDMTEYDRKLYLYQQAVLEHSKQNRVNNDKYNETEDEKFERQKYILQNILEELCVRQYEYENVEGDDIVAYYVKNRKDNEKIVIVSSDKDLTQLISEDVIIYNPRIKDFITKDNSIEKIGITHKNVVLEKILCGDVSDNIKGVKGLGEQTLIKLFPNIKTEKTDLEAIVARSKEILEERKQTKKKPLKTLENIINGITDGCQGDKIYEINQKIIDLSEPLLTDEAKDSLDLELYSVMDTSDRDVKNIYNIIRVNKMEILFDEEKFGNLFSPYYRIITMEKNRFKEMQNWLV
jgi:5'-3' exonuclease